MEYKSQQVGREQIRYLDFEGNGESLLFAHGIGQKPEAYGNLLRELSKTGYRVIAPELYGRNYLQRQPTTIAEYAKITSNFIDSLDLEGVVLVGHSLGGAVSFEVARQNKDKIEKVIGLSPGLPIDHRGLSGILRGTTNYLRNRLRTPFKSAAFFISNTLPIDLHLARRPIVWAKIIEDIRTLEVSHFQVDVPSLILHAEHDELVELDVETEERIARQGVVIKRLLNLNHNWPISHYNLATDEICRFLTFK